LPYPPVYEAHLIVPPDAALMSVPYGAAISSPPCVWSLTLSFTPNLDVMFPPVTGKQARYIPFTV